MVILQFNKLIRNRWVWGVFAVAVSAFFAFDFLFTGDDYSGASREVGKLGDMSVSASDYQDALDDAYGPGRNRSDIPREVAERSAWEQLSTLEVAKANELEVTDPELRQVICSEQSFMENGAFSPARYRQFLDLSGTTAERFESFYRRQLTARRVNGPDGLVGSAAWVSPAEVDSATADMTDVFTIKVATFEEDAKAAAAIKLDDAACRSWYDANTNQFLLPERMQVRMVRYDATDTNLLARMTVSDDLLQDYFDANSSRYTKPGTNASEKVEMTFDEAREQADRDLRIELAVECLRTNLIARVYGSEVVEGASRLDAVAKEDGRRVETSGWFSLSDRQVAGFMINPDFVCFGAKSFREIVAALDPENEDARYDVVASERSVWLLERGEVSPAHLPSYDDENMKSIVAKRALTDAKAEAFRSNVVAIIAKGTNEIYRLAANVTSNSFSVVELKKGEVPDGIVAATIKLSAGEISEGVKLSASRLAVVVCENRTACDDATRVLVMKGQIRRELAAARFGQLSEAWRKWNLERLGKDVPINKHKSADEADDAEADE